MEIPAQSYHLNFEPALWVLLLGITVYLLYKIFNRFVSPLLRNAQLWIAITKFLPVILRLAVLLFCALFIFSLVAPNPISGTVVVLLSITASWSYIRNFISGLFLLLDGSLKIGQKIHVGEYKGTIAAFKSGQVVLDLEAGEQLNLPYVNLMEGPLVIKSPSKKVISHSFELEIAKPCDLELEKEKLRTVIATIPWLLPESNPNIDVLAQNEHSYKLKLIVQGIDKRQLEMTEEAIRLKLKSKS